MSSKQCRVTFTFYCIWQTNLQQACWPSFFSSFPYITRLAEGFAPCPSPHAHLIGTLRASLQSSCMASCFSSPERRQGSPRGTSPERTAARPGTGCATAVEAAFFSSGSDAVLSPRLCGLGSPRSVSSAGTDARETPSSRGRPPRAPSPSSTTRSPRSTSPNIFPDPPVRNPVRVGGGFSDTPSRTREEAMSPEREEEVYVSLTDPGDMSSGTSSLSYFDSST